MPQGSYTVKMREVTLGLHTRMAVKTELLKNSIDHPCIFPRNSLLTPSQDKD